MKPMPVWKIMVARKTEIIAELTVPAYRLTEKDLDDLSRALVVRYRNDTVEEMLPYYLNRRRGKPERLNFADPKPYTDEKKLESGVYCGNWDCYAYASQRIGIEHAEAAKVRNEDLGT